MLIVYKTEIFIHKSILKLINNNNQETIQKILK